MTPHSHDALAVSRWIERFTPLVRRGARLLDVAAGQGRHARHFAQRGVRVLAVDRDRDALGACDGVANVETRVVDLEAGAWPLAHERFDAIVVVHYLHRPALPHLLDALTPDGVLLYETFAAGNERYGRPSNPAFLLRDGELLDVARERLTIVAFEQGRIDEARTAVVQRLAAVGREYARPPPLPR